jgi:hypothetical protein
LARNGFAIAGRFVAGLPSLPLHRADMREAHCALAPVHCLDAFPLRETVSTSLQDASAPDEACGVSRDPIEDA